MNTIIIILFIVCYIPLWFATVRYDIQMFQQNSYRTDRYLRWLMQSNIVKRATVTVLPAVIGLLPFISEAVFCGLAIVIMLGAAATELRTKYKKPIVYTMRVGRLFVTAGLLTAIAITVATIFIPRYMPSVVLALTSLPLIMLCANIVNKPLEAAVTRWYYNDASRILRSMPDLKIIGVTGSFGKTSTKHYLYRILSEKYNVLMTPGNFNTTLGVVRTVREQLKPYHQVFIVEMGAKQTGDIREICDLVHPSIGVVTAVGEMHLETFHTVDNILHTKFELLDSLPHDGLGVINLDSEPIAAASKPLNCAITSYAVTNTAADYRGVNINYTSAQTSFDVNFKGDVRMDYATRLVGRGNILNLLAAVAVADYMGVEEQLQKRAMRRIEQIEHRLSIKRTAGGVTIIDDAYNSNPEGARMALEVLRDFRTEGGKRIVVTPGFVELGTRQYELNRQLGRDMADACDLAIVVNFTNRQSITQGLEDEGYPKENLREADSFAEASAILSGMLRTGDVVLYENDLPDSFR